MFADYAQWEEWKGEGAGIRVQGSERPYAGCRRLTQPAKGGWEEEA